MSNVQMQDLLEAGMHFGHLTRRWNPKMKPFIYGVRNGIHIIDLSKTVRQLQTALQFIERSVGEGRDVLIVGTKRQAREIIAEEATRSGSPFVDQRWLGGMLTNFKTIKQSTKRLKDMEAMTEDGSLEKLGKKEALMTTRELAKLQKSIGGIKEMNTLPSIEQQMQAVNDFFHRLAEEHEHLEYNNTEEALAA